MKSIAEALRVNASFIVTQSRPLEELGLIRRKSSITDKRIVYLSATSKALKELARLQNSRDTVTESIKREMGDAATLHTIELLRQLERSLARCRARLQIED